MQTNIHDYVIFLKFKQVGYPQQLSTYLVRPHAPVTSISIE